MTIRRPIRLTEKSGIETVESNERSLEQSLEVARRVCIYSERAGRILNDVASGKVPPRSSLTIFEPVPANPEKPPGTCAFWGCMNRAMNVSLCSTHYSQARVRGGYSLLTPINYRVPCPRCGKMFPPIAALACPKCLNPGGLPCKGPNCKFKAKPGSDMCQWHAGLRRRKKPLDTPMPAKVYVRPPLNLTHEGCGGKLYGVSAYKQPDGRSRRRCACLACLRYVLVDADGAQVTTSALKVTTKLPKTIRVLLTKEATPCTTQS